MHRTLGGSPKFYLTTVGIDAQISKTLALADSAVLTPYLGQTVKFGSSLKVEKGDIVGITVPTWAPVFSQALSANNVWRASREPGACTNSTDIRQGQPQEAVGKRATYGCKYTTARLLYTATLVEEH